MTSVNGSKSDPQVARNSRRDGWTETRRAAFLAALAAECDVGRACARVGLTREGAYRLRKRDAAFARAWAASQREASAADERGFLELLAERLPAVAAAVSGELRERGFFPLDRVTPGPSL